jgi:hypothetical protein
MYFLLAIIFLLSNASSFTLERKQFNSFKCLSSVECVHAEEIEWFKCQGETNHSLSCRTNLPLEVKNLLIQCDATMNHCSAEFTLSEMDGTILFLPVIEFWLNMVVTLLQVMTLQPIRRVCFDSIRPNAVLWITEQTSNSELYLIYCLFITLIIIVLLERINTHRSSAEPLIRSTEPDPVELPNNVKLIQFDATPLIKKYMIQDKEMLNNVIRHCSEEFKSTILLELNCEKMVRSDETILYYEMWFDLDDDTIMDNHIKTLIDLYPTKIESISVMIRNYHLSVKVLIKSQLLQ